MKNTGSRTTHNRRTLQRTEDLLEYVKQSRAGLAGTDGLDPEALEELKSLERQSEALVDQARQLTRRSRKQQPKAAGTKRRATDAASAAEPPSML
jgi:hypothetical protein